MYSEEEMALLPRGIERHPVTPSSFEFAQLIGLLADDSIELIALPGELPEIALREGK